MVEIRGVRGRPRMSLRLESGQRVYSAVAAELLEGVAADGH